MDIWLFVKTVLNSLVIYLLALSYGPHKQLLWPLPGPDSYVEFQYPASALSYSIASGLHNAGSV